MTRTPKLAFSVLLVLAVLPLCAAAIGDEPVAPAAPEAAGLPAPPAGDPGTEIAPLDLQPPEAIRLCKTGFCSNDEQCELWVGPGSTCSIAQGQTCGECLF